jgi:hypothetical protein
MNYDTNSHTDMLCAGYKWALGVHPPIPPKGETHCVLQGTNDFAYRLLVPSLL